MTCLLETRERAETQGRRPLILHARVVTGTGGGPDKTIINSPRFLTDAGYETLCVYMRSPGDRGFSELERRAHNQGARLLAVDDHGPFDWRILHRFDELCERHAPDVWHGHDYKSNMIGIWLRRRRPAMRLVTTVHGWVKRTWKTPAYYAIDRLCLRQYDRVLCVSEDLYEQCRRLGVAGDRLCHVPNAIDTDEHRRRTPREEAKRRLGVAPGRLLIGAIGRLSPEKGFDLLIRAVADLVRQGHDLELRIAGEGDDHRRLECLIRSLGLASRALLLGFCSDPAEFYEAMDVFASSSLREGLPNVLLEAMATGLPALSTDVGGVGRAIRHGENGWLVEAGSAAPLARGLNHVLSDTSLRERLGRAARTTVERQFSFRRRMDRVAATYDELLH